jgi:hypothetical protein
VDDQCGRCVNVDCLAGDDEAGHEVPHRMGPKPESIAIADPEAWMRRTATISDNLVTIPGSWGLVCKRMCANYTLSRMRGCSGVF